MGVSRWHSRSAGGRVRTSSENDNNFVLKWFLRITRFPPPTFPFPSHCLPSPLSPPSYPLLRVRVGFFLPTSFADNADTIFAGFSSVSRPRSSLLLLLLLLSSFSVEERRKRRDTRIRADTSSYDSVLCRVLVIFYSRGNSGCFARYLFASHSRGRKRERERSTSKGEKIKQLGLGKSISSRSHQIATKYNSLGG